MFHPNFSVYLGHEDEQSFVGFSAENGFFAILKVEAGLAKEKGRELLKKISLELEQASIKNLNEFETFLVAQFKQADIPSSFSCAAGFVHDNILWLKTVGIGQIYLRRGREFAKLIEGENSASGYLSPDDFFIFATKEFAQVLENEIQLKDVFNHKNPHEILEMIAPRLKKQDDTGIIALFVSFEAEKAVENELILQDQPKQPGSREKFLTILDNVKAQLQTQDRKKTWTFVGVALLLIIFVWSVVLGYQRRINSQSRQKIETAKEIITEELKQAEEVVFLNLPRATALINEAKKNLADLKKQVRNPDSKDIQELEKLIADKEGRILKKEEKKSEEYFDLSIENKNASGQTMYLDGENLAVLDPQGAIYLLSLTKKSLDRRASADIKNSSLVGLYQDKTYVFRKGIGIIELSPDGKSKKAIDNDPDWKDIVGLSAYNGNLYLLDRGQNEVYKYLVAESGFSKKNPYFQPDQKPNLTNANSVAIDASVYVGFTNRVLKYISGVQDNFNPSFPEEDSQLTKIFTSKDVGKIYGWDKDKGAIYVIDKDGVYERQINSSIFSKASDFVVFDNNAYVLVGSKIFSVSVE